MTSAVAATIWARRAVAVTDSRAGVSAFADCIAYSHR